MKFNEIHKPKITESVSSVIYYATTFSAAEKILSSAALKGYGGISFTRSLQGAYHKKNKIIGVIFEFDGDKLNHKYKGGPVGTENWDYDEDDYDKDDKHTWSHRGRENGQLEDRIYADKINNVTAYIKSAIMYLPAEYVETHKEDKFGESYDQIKHAEDVVNLLNLHNIPIRYITSEKDLANPRANDKEGFSKLILKMDGKIEELYEIKYSLYQPDDEEPWFKHFIVRKVANNMDDAVDMAEKLIHNVSRKTKEPEEYIDVASVVNTITGDRYIP